MILMRRLAIFVEGYTELLFVDRLIRELAQKKQIAIQQRQVRGGGRRNNTKKHYKEIQTPVLEGGELLYILIVDCGGDRLVAQRVREEHESLSKNGYEAIVGLRDVFPDFTKADIDKLRKGMRYQVKTNLIPVHFLLAIMEIEAWFLAEHNHFSLIDPAITVETINKKLGFNPRTDDMSDRFKPATDLNNAYMIGGKSYVKGNSKGTVDKLDYDYVYIFLREKIPDLDNFLRIVENFLTQPATAVT